MLNKKTLMQDTVARPLPDSRWGLMNRQDGGYSRSCLPYNTLLEMWQDFDISFGQRGQDEHGEFIRVVRGSSPTEVPAGLNPGKEDNNARQG